MLMYCVCACVRVRVCVSLPHTTYTHKVFVDMLATLTLHIKPELQNCLIIGYNTETVTFLTVYLFHFVLINNQNTKYMSGIHELH